MIVAGTQSLLAEKIELEVYVISANISAELAQTLEKLHPDTVIVDEAVRATLPDRLRHMLDSQPGIQLITFNQDDNLVTIHEGERSAKAYVGNLGKVIRSHGSPSNLAE
jgi:hypothetical protein